jgi:putative ABC transport system permease protein
MNRKRLLLRLMLKAVWVRRDRALTALLSITVVATMATVALTVYSDLEGKFSREFRSFGANVVITAPAGVSTSDLSKIKAAAGNKAAVVPVGYAIVQGPTGADIVIGGADLVALKDMNSWWSVASVPAATGDALLGSRAEEAVSPKGTPFLVSYNGRQIQIRPAAVFHSGSDDDSRIYVSLQQFAELTGTQPSTVQVRIPGTPAQIEDAIQRLSASLPQNQNEVKPVRQVTVAQTAVLGKTRAIVLAASGVVVVLIVLCMVATLTGSVLERRKDFAVMKALGASNRTLNVLFAGEASLTSIIGAIAGFVFGSGIAYWIGAANFGAAIMPRPELLPFIVLGSIVLALLASTAPLRLLRRIQPAGILRGE